MVRVRFAPSPTGYLHVGNARTALFNYVFARKNSGQFILRIEDTDQERSAVKYEQAIIEDLRWLGLDWDEGPEVGGNYGPYRQTERLHLYQELAEKFLQAGLAYRCYCTREELEGRKQQALQEKGMAGYDGRCRYLTQAQVAAFHHEGRKPVVRFQVPAESIEVNDLIRGKVVFAGETISDFVIIKSDGLPTFHFAVVVDDFLMGITHVIRGEDHLSNTPKHILLFRALKARLPFFAHMSMTLGPDRTRLSKRHGATSIRAFRQAGYLPEALFNYLALLGWASPDGQEIFTREELVREFSLERCSKTAAIFDHNKLLWMNGLYMRKTSPERLLQLSLPLLQAQSLAPQEPTAEFLAKTKQLIALEQEKFKTLSDIPERIGFFLKTPVYDSKLIEKYFTPQTREILAEIEVILADQESFEHHKLEEAIRTLCQEKAYKPAQVFHPLRIALSGTTKGPGLFEMMEILGKEETIGRLQAVIKNETFRSGKDGGPGTPP
ncbi:MAG: glutamate--tRNA ligase [Candidatus Omnitrophica bacterium]|nr:glutamate--tRNA ligase [Candidatus Omnitrophota bacterium]